MNVKPTIPDGYCLCGCGERTSGLPRRNGGLTMYVNGHSLRMQRPYGLITEADYTVEDRGFTTPCWVFKGLGRTGPIDGYRKVRFSGRRELAHRAMYEQERGPIPAGMTLDHLCNVKPCVNPGHLEPVPFRENVRRRQSNKLSMEKAREIRALHAGGWTRAELAERFSCSLGAINDVVTRRYWRED